MNLHLSLSGLLLIALLISGCQDSRSGVQFFMPAIEGWYVIVFNQASQTEASNDWNVNFNKPSFVFVSTPFDAGWAEDKFWIREGGQTVSVQSLGYDIFEDHIGSVSLELEGEEMRYRAFYLGKGPPTTQPRLDDALEAAHSVR